MGLKFSFMSNVSKDKRFYVRKAVACEALEYGIKPTARRFNMSKNTVRTLMRRFQSEGNDGLMDRRSGPKCIPHKTSTIVENQVVAIRRLAPCYGARRLKYYFQLSASVGAIQRIIKDHGLTRKKRRHHQKKNDLRAIKQLFFCKQP